MSKRILIADEADLTLIGIQTILSRHSDWAVAATARSADDLLTQISQHQPDIIVLGERLDPDMDVLMLVERARRTAPRAGLVVLGGLAEGLLIRDLFASGVLAYLFAGDDLQDHLLPALRAAAANRFYLSPTASSAYLVAMKSPLRDWQLDREARTVLRLLMAGRHIAEIARELDIPLRRAYWLRRKLRQRFGASTNEHLISRAVAEGYANPEA